MSVLKTVIRNVSFNLFKSLPYSGKTVLIFKKNLEDKNHSFLVKFSNMILRNLNIIVIFL